MLADWLIAVLNNAYTFKRAYDWNFLAWQIQIRCDDIDGTCAKNERKRAFNPAYTINPGKRPGFVFEAKKDTIVICPKIFKDVKTCATALKEGQSDRTYLTNFLCRGTLNLLIKCCIQGPDHHMYSGRNRWMLNRINV